MKDFFQTIWIQRALVAFFISIHFAIAYTSALRKSPTIDEYTYIASGYYYVKTGDFRLDRTHPPLIRLLTGISLQFLDINEPDPQMEKWGGPASYELGYLLGKDMLLEKGNNVQTILLAARLPILLLSCGLAGLIYLWAKDLYGFAGGLTALFLYVLCPNMLAHGRLATLDTGTSFFIVLALYCLCRYTKTHTPLRLLFAGMALGAALAAKITAWILLPVYLVAITWTLAKKQKSMDKFPLACLIVKQAGFMFLIAVFVLFFIYGFPVKPFYYLDTVGNVITKSLSGGKGGIDVPGMPHRNHAFYLMGNYSTDGWPYYYLMAAAVKTPVAIFVALFGFLLMGKQRWREYSDGIIVGTILLLHLLAAFNRVNIGLRHVLPFYPLLYLYMGRIAGLGKKRMGMGFLAILGIWYGASCAMIYPDYLSYFNEAAGGPENGHNYLDDSNIDWGQDLGRLALVAGEYPGEPLYIAQEYIFDPAAYGFSAKPLQQEQIANPPKGIVAVSKHWAIRRRIQPRSPYYFNWLEKYEPIGRAGHSIWLFRFE